MKEVIFGLILLRLVILTPEALANGEGVKLSVVTYNVHGLPWFIARDDPDSRMPRISKIAANYDFAVLQEVFGFRETFLNHLGNHQLFSEPTREFEAATVSPSLFGVTLPFDSGLATFVGKTYAVANKPIQATFDHCAGWIGDSFDCWAAKGVSATEVVLPNGVKLHIYNTHLDAGNSEDSARVRELQLERIALLVEEFSAGLPLILVGDLNLSLSHPPEPKTFESWKVYENFLVRLGLTDTGARGTDCNWENSQNDYILYRSGQDATLRLLEAGEDVGFIENGVPFSDHPALFADFAAEPVEQTHLSLQSR